METFVKPLYIVSGQFVDLRDMKVSSISCFIGLKAGIFDVSPVEVVVNVLLMFSHVIAERLMIMTDDERWFST